MKAYCVCTRYSVRSPIKRLLAGSLLPFSYLWLVRERLLPRPVITVISFNLYVPMVAEAPEGVQVIVERKNQATMMQRLCFAYLKKVAPSSREEGGVGTNWKLTALGDD